MRGRVAVFMMLNIFFWFWKKLTIEITLVVFTCAITKLFFVWTFWLASTRLLVVFKLSLLFLIHRFCKYIWKFWIRIQRNFGSFGNKNGRIYFISDHCIFFHVCMLDVVDVSNGVHRCLIALCISKTSRVVKFYSFFFEWKIILCAACDMGFFEWILFCGLYAVCLLSFLRNIFFVFLKWWLLSFISLVSVFVVFFDQGN